MGMGMSERVHKMDEDYVPVTADLCSKTRERPAERGGRPSMQRELFGFERLAAGLGLEPRTY